MGTHSKKTCVGKQHVRLVGVTAASALMFAPMANAAEVPGGDSCGTTPGCTNGVTALLVGGQGSYAVLTEEQMSTAFGGYFSTYDQRISVPFPGDAEFSVSIPEGATNLYNVVYTHEATLGTPLTIGGVSKGAPSVIEALRRLEADRENLTDGREPPSPDEMNVMIYGAPSRIYYAAVRYRPALPVTPYDVVLVSAEYDGVADFPDNPFNILAVLNAYQGGDMLHVDAAFNTDFKNDPMHYKVETNKDGGMVTTIVIPYTDPILPLLYPMLEDGGDPVKLAKLSAVLKPIIDSAYRRNHIFQRNKWTDGIVDIPLPAAATSGPDTAESGGTTTLQASRVAAPEIDTETVEKQTDLEPNVEAKKTRRVSESKDAEDRSPGPVARVVRRWGERITSRLDRGGDKPGARAGATSSAGSDDPDSGSPSGSGD